jgi:hypothetical protein
MRFEVKDTALETYAKTPHFSLILKGLAIAVHATCINRVDNDDLSKAGPFHLLVSVPS